jgi:hypothetical protein
MRIELKTTIIVQIANKKIKILKYRGIKSFQELFKCYFWNYEIFHGTKIHLYTQNNY